MWARHCPKGWGSSADRVWHLLGTVSVYEMEKYNLSGQMQSYRCKAWPEKCPLLQSKRHLCMRGSVTAGLMLRSAVQAAFQFSQALPGHPDAEHDWHSIHSSPGAYDLVRKEERH